MIYAYHHDIHMTIASAASPSPFHAVVAAAGLNVALTPAAAVTAGLNVALSSATCRTECCARSCRIHQHCYTRCAAV